MLSAAEKSFVLTRAYIPEHIFEYVSSISEMEPFLISNYICYRKKDWLNFIGYPLGEGKVLEECLDEAVEKFKPVHVGIIAPKLPHLYSRASHKKQLDTYFKLDLEALKIERKVRNMVKRAGRELEVERSKSITPEHRQLISEFSERQKLDEYMQQIFEGIPRYTSSCSTALVLNARNKKGELVAFNVADLASEDFAFYQFNFASRKKYVPGSTDLLFHEIVKVARENGKKYINMGLGINAGNRRFKRKWGGKPFLEYELGICSQEYVKALKLSELWGV